MAKKELATTEYKSTMSLYGIRRSDYYPIGEVAWPWDQQRFESETSYHVFNIYEGLGMLRVPVAAALKWYEEIKNDPRFRVSDAPILMTLENGEELSFYSKNDIINKVIEWARLYEWRARAMWHSKALDESDARDFEDNKRASLNKIRQHSEKIAGMIVENLTENDGANLKKMADENKVIVLDTIMRTWLSSVKNRTNTMPESELLASPQNLLERVRTLGVLEEYDDETILALAEYAGPIADDGRDTSGTEDTGTTRLIGSGGVSQANNVSTTSP